MKNFKTCFLGILLVVLFISSSLAGVWTGNKFIYKPQEGARGTIEKNYFDVGLDQVDARLGKEIWVGDPNYGTTLQDAITAIGSTPAILRVAAGSYNIAADFAIPANVTLKPERGAIFTIATGQTLTINGSFEAGLYQVFSCQGTGRVQFGYGAVPRVNAKWFGAQGDGVTDNLAALNQSRLSLPLFDGVSTNESGELNRRGVIYLPQGDYRISNTFKYGIATILEGDGQWKTMLGFQDGIATSSEKFVIAIDRYIDGANGPMSFRTHGVYLKGIEIYGNKATNPYSSGIQWYGAEMNGLIEVYVDNCALRGIVLGNDNQDGGTQCSNTSLSRVLINDITQGPGLQVNAYHFFADDLAVTYVNTGGIKSGGEYIPGVRFVYSNNAFVGTLKTECCSGQSVRIENSQSVNIGNMFGFWTSADSAGDRTALRITGAASYYIDIGMVHAQNMTYLIKDDGWTGGTQRSKTIQTANQSYSQYSTSTYGYDLQSETGTIGALTVNNGANITGNLNICDPTYSAGISYQDSGAHLIQLIKRWAGQFDWQMGSSGGTKTLGSLIGYPDAGGNHLDLFKQPDGTITVRLNTNGNSYFISGNVGIGTTSPGQALQIGGSGGMGGVVSNGGVSPTFTSTFTGNDGPFIFGATQDSSNYYERYLDLGIAAYSDSTGINGGGAIRFWTSNVSAGSAGTRAPTERMRIERNGSVVVGATNADSKALLKLSSTTQGFLPPVMTTAQKNAISSPPEGLVVYDSTLHKLSIYNGSAWETVTSSVP